jgi:putative sugar O-methyltransferase
MTNIKNGEFFQTFLNENYKQATTFEEMFAYCPFAKPHSTANVNGLLKARQLNETITESLLKKDRYDIKTLTQNDMDFVSSNHYILCIYLIHYLTQMNYTMDNCNIVDIGGGFGNTRRILSNYFNINSYTIFDLDCTLYFNELYLKKYDNKYNLFKNVNIQEKGFYNIGLDFRDNFDSFDKLKLDVVIAAHSLSEISLEEFNWYFEHIIKKCKIFIYTTQVVDSGYNPCSLEITLQKINIIKSIMHTYLEIEQPGEGRNCKMFIFTNLSN